SLISKPSRAPDRNRSGAFSNDASASLTKNNFFRCRFRAFPNDYLVKAALGRRETRRRMP
ncbi:MAG: hypothetical protein ACRELG_00460, partial [Gemmataceae bacterium]